MSSAYYLYDPPAVTVTTSNPINVLTQNNSNLTCYNLSVYNNQTTNGNINCLQNLICNQTIYCTSINTQNYYVTNVVATSNVSTYDIFLTDCLYHNRNIGSNVVQQTIVDNQGYIEFSNIKNFPTGGQSTASWFSGLASVASAGASLLNSGLSIGNGLESLFGSGASTAAGIGENLADNLGNSLQDGSGDITSNFNSSNSVLVSWKNLSGKNLYSDPNNTAIQANLVLSDTSSILYDRTASYSLNTNKNLTYTKVGQTKILDVPGSILYMNNLSNVATIDLSNIQLRNDGTLRRSIYNSNIIGIDGISFCNFTLSNIKVLTSSNIICQSLSTSNILNTGSNTPLYIYSSNQIISSSSNQTYINANPLVVNYGVSFGSNNNIYNASNITSQSLSNTSFYTGASNLYVAGDVITASLAVNSNQLLVNKKLISSSDFSNNALWTSNGAVYCNTLIVNGITKTPILSMSETVPITSNYQSGLYAGSKLVINGNDATIYYADSMNGPMMQSGTFAANKPLPNSSYQASYNYNLFSL